MRLLTRFTALLIFLFQLTCAAQTDIQRDSRVDPFLKQVAAKRPGLRMFSRRNDKGGYVNMSVLHEGTRTLKWFTCHGVLFDSVELNVDEYSQMITGVLDPFVFYRNYCHESLYYIKRAEDLYRLKGNEALKDTTHNNRVVFNSPAVMSAQTNLQKLIAIERLIRRTSLQLLLFDSKPPSKLFKYQAPTVLSGLAGAMVRKADSTEYYNADILAKATRIVLRYNSPNWLFVYGRDGTLTDSIPLKSGKYASLLKDREDVFLLYRGWLEFQWQQLSDMRLQYVNQLSRIEANLYRPVSWEESRRQVRNVLTGLQERQHSISDKIGSLIVPEEQYIEQLLAAAYKDEQTEISYLPGIGFAYNISYTRGQKQYELTDRRGNVMVVVSDKKKGVNENGESFVEYYNADIVSANDYYPFGMLAPGRVYSSGSNYRYGYNGKENDNEVKGEGNQQDYGMRVYDPRIAKFLSVDPLSPDFPWLSPYQFAGNTPIWAIDLDGAEQLIPMFGFNTPLMGAADLLETGLDVGARATPGAGLGPALSSVRIGPGGSMIQELPFNWTSFDAMPVLPVPQGYTMGRGPLLNAPNERSIPEQLPEKQPQPSANPQRQFDPEKAPQKDEEDEEDTYIYRGGNFSDVNFTPRPGKDDKYYDPKGGLSTFKDPLDATQGKGGKAQKISVKKLKSLGFELSEVGSHVGIKPKSEGALKEWAATRPDVADKKRQAHLLTKILKKARVDEVQVTSSQNKKQ